MGKFFVTILKFPKKGSCSCIQFHSRHSSILRIVKIDGKLLKFKNPILVKDVPVSFAGFGIGVSRKATEVLESDAELRLGSVYYVVPRIAEKTERVRGCSVSGSGSVKKRIKVVITKKQLQDLLSEKVSMEDVIEKVLDSSPGSWKPRLESIPE